MALRTSCALAAAITLTIACSSTSDPAGPAPSPTTVDAAPTAPSGDAAPTDAAPSTADAGPNTDVGTCAASFGNALTASFGRIDGELVAFVRPQDQQCAMPNGDHLTVQVKMDGAVYRMVVNVASDRGSDGRVRLGTFSAALPAPAFAEGWHTGVELDYAALGAHSTEGFEALEMDEVVTRVVGALHIGDPISVYATSGKGRPESAHLVHRNDGKTDGAIVIDPKGAPKFLLFHFADQTF